MAKQFIDAEKFQQDGAVNFPLKFQVESLGLDKPALEQLRGKKALDIGCGSEARLVYFLLQRGICAEGIDERILPNPSKPFLHRGHLDRHTRFTAENETYDLVVAHSLDTLDLGLTTFQEAASVVLPLIGIQQYDRALMTLDARGIVAEALRVMKRDGRFVVRPALNKLGDFEKQLSDLGYKIQTQNISRTACIEENELLVRSAERMGLPRGFFDFFNQRAVITYAGCQNG